MLIQDCNYNIVCYDSIKFSGHRWYDLIKKSDGEYISRVNEDVSSLLGASFYDDENIEQIVELKLFDLILFYDNELIKYMSNLEQMEHEEDMLYNVGVIISLNKDNLSVRMFGNHFKMKNRTHEQIDMANDYANQFLDLI